MYKLLRHLHIVTTPNQHHHILYLIVSTTDPQSVQTPRIKVRITQPSTMPSIHPSYNIPSIMYIGFTNSFQLPHLKKKDVQYQSQIQVDQSQLQRCNLQSLLPKKNPVPRTGFSEIFGNSTWLNASRHSLSTKSPA